MLRPLKRSGVANAAVPLLALATLVMPSIFRRELVTLCAVSLSPIGSRSEFPAVEVAARNVDPMRDGLQMLRIHAAPVKATPSDLCALAFLVACVVNVHTFGDRADMRLVGQSMRGEQLPMSATNSDTRVSASVNTSEPSPTAGSFIDGVQFSESLQHWGELWASRHESILSGDRAYSNACRYRYGMGA